MQSYIKHAMLPGWLEEQPRLLQLNTVHTTLICRDEQDLLHGACGIGLLLHMPIGFRLRCSCQG